jgi:hypothetical protein
LTKLDFPLTKLWFFVSFGAISCAGSSSSGTPEDSTISTDETVAVADVVGVTATGSDGSWTFSVTIRSDETGCDRYADWWELLTPEGDLVYRRILAHSHPDDQPFTRAAEEPIDVTSATELYARAHLAPGGYEGSVFGGTIDGGFLEIDIANGFAVDLESTAPQPDACLF